MGGIPEFLKHGINGFLVVKHNIEKYAEYILTVIDNTRLRSKLGANAVSLINQRYSEDVVIPHYLKLYDSIQQSGERVVIA